MTKKQRAQVVELLRCAADLGMQGVVAPLSEASWRIGARATPNERIAGEIVGAIVDEYENPWWSDGWDDYAEHCLEAAQRVEDEEWP